VPFEILHGALVLLRRGARIEGAEIAAPAGLRILLARIEPVFAGRQFADHGDAPNVVFMFKAKLAACVGSDSLSLKSQFQTATHFLRHHWA
jgi:hypothetical protein